MSGCTIFSYFYKTLQKKADTVSTIVDKTWLQNKLDICVPYTAMGDLSVKVKRKIALDSFIVEQDFKWRASVYFTLAENVFATKLQQHECRMALLAGN